MSILPEANPGPTSPDRLFTTTRWSLVIQARGEDAPVATRALDDLLRLYWKPLYVFARRSQLAESDAEDAVQSFCETLIRRQSLHHADQSQGRLRTYLLSAFQNHLRTLHRYQHRLKRDGGGQFLTLEELESAEGGKHAVYPAAVNSDSPDLAFDRSWAHALLEEVIRQMRVHYAEWGRDGQYLVLEPAVLCRETDANYADMAQALGMTPAAVAQAVCRLRLHFRELVEDAIGDTVAGPQAMKEERDHLISVLSQK